MHSKVSHCPSVGFSGARVYRALNESICVPKVGLDHLNSNHCCDHKLNANSKNSSRKIDIFHKTQWSFSKTIESKHLKGHLVPPRTIHSGYGCQQKNWTLQFLTDNLEATLDNVEENEM